MWSILKIIWQDPLGVPKKYDKDVENSTMWSILKIIWQDPLGVPKKYDKIYEQPQTKMNYMYQNYQ